MPSFNGKVTVNKLQCVQQIKLVNPKEVEKEIVVNAIVDTGAYRSAICPTIVDKLNLISRGKRPTEMASGIEEFNIYQVILVFENHSLNKMSYSIQVASPNKETSIKALIGMDVLTRGVFILNKKEFTLAF